MINGYRNMVLATATGILWFALSYVAIEITSTLVSGITMKSQVFLGVVFSLQAAISVFVGYVCRRRSVGVLSIVAALFLMLTIIERIFARSYWVIEFDLFSLVVIAGDVVVSMTVFLISFALFSKRMEKCAKLEQSRPKH